MSVSESGEDMRVDLRVLLGALASRWLRIALVTLLLLAATFAVMQFVPKLYESSASVLVEERSNAFTRVANEQQSSNAASADALLLSQIELIKSRDTLLSVVDALNLRDVREFNGASASPLAMIMQLFGARAEPRSGDERVLENLNERLTVSREGNSSVISIYVRSTNPQLAADIANAIADAHVKRRAGLSLSDTAEATGWLETEIAKLRTRVQDAENAVADYRSDNDLFLSGTGSSSILDQQLSNIATQITSAQERKNVAQSRANLIRGLIRDGQPIDGVADVRDSLIIQNLVQSKASLQGELAQRSSTLLSNHPTIRALRAQIAAIDQEIAAEGRKVADALDSQARVEADLEQSLNQDLARLKTSVSEATRDSVELASLEREAKAQRDLLESYLARYSDAAARTDASSALPDVRVVTVAAPADKPASPNVTLALAAVGFLSVALQGGTILFGELMSGRAIIRRPADPMAAADVPVAVDQPIHAATAIPAETRAPLFGFLRRGRPQPSQPEPQHGPGADEAVDEPVQAPVAASPLTQPASMATQDPPAAPVEPTTVAEAEGRAEMTAGDAALELSNLAADIAIGRVRVVFLSALDSFEAVDRVARVLVESALERGLSVATIDAGSARPSDMPGLSDLSVDAASFGEVVNKVSATYASIPWGRRRELERRSMKPVTLVEALTDLYEVVIVSTGPVDLFSALPVFSGLEGRLVLVSDQLYPDRRQVQTSLSQAATLGFEVGQLVTAPARRSVA